MKKIKGSISLGILVVLSLMILLSGCGKEERGRAELAEGNWTLYHNRAYILLIIYPKGDWYSSVMISDATSKIVKSKGRAKGTWNIDEGQMIFTVSDSDIEDIWKKNGTQFYDLVALTETEMHLKDENGRVSVWKKTNAQKAAATQEDVQLVLPMGPIVVNLNKNRSNDKDRYLCLNLNLELKELMPDQEPPPIHPRVYDAAIIFLSALVQNDVKDFDSLKEQNKKLLAVINPYMENMVREIEIEHVIVANDITKVEEFIIEHTMTENPDAKQGDKQDEEGKPKDENGAKKAEAKKES